MPRYCPSCDSSVSLVSACSRKKQRTCTLLPPSHLPDSSTCVMYVTQGFPHSGRTTALISTSAVSLRAWGRRSSRNVPPWLMSKCSPARLTKCGSPFAPTVGAGVENSGYGPAGEHTPVPLGCTVHTSVVSQQSVPHAQQQPPA